MPVGELCIRQVVVAPRNASVLDAAKLMRQHHVGDIVVTDDIAGRRVPVGIVTDRDWIIDLGPEAGDAGGRIVGMGTPEKLCEVQSEKLRVQSDKPRVQTPSSGSEPGQPAGGQWEARGNRGELLQSRVA